MVGGATVLYFMVAGTLVVVVRMWKLLACNLVGWKQRWDREWRQGINFKVVPLATHFLQLGMYCPEFHNLPKQHNQLDVMCSNPRACGGIFMSMSYNFSFFMWALMTLQQLSFKTAEGEGRCMEILGCCSTVLVI